MADGFLLTLNFNIMEILREYGLKPNSPEIEKRFLELYAMIDEVQFLAMVKLYQDKPENKFKSDMRDILVDWLSGNFKYKLPFTQKRFETFINPDIEDEAKHIETKLFFNSSEI